MHGRHWVVVRRLKPHRSIDLIDHIGYPFLIDRDLRDKGRFLFFHGLKGA
jgi:hypothetical protein